MAEAKKVKGKLRNRIMLKGKWVDAGTVVTLPEAMKEYLEDAHKNK